MASSRSSNAQAGALNRRRFLRGCAGICGVWGALRVLPGRAAEAPDDQAPVPALPRTLRFVHTHTAERLTATYFDGVAYDPACLREVDYLLRDFRNSEIHPIDPALLDLLHAVQGVTDNGAPFEVISAYRSPSTNAMLRRRSGGVAEHSQHLLGKAIDVRLPGLPTCELQRIGLALARGGVGYYPVSDFVHLDTGPIRAW